MKTPQQVLTDLTGRVADWWAATVASEAALEAGRQPVLSADDSRAATWPKTLHLGNIKATRTSSDLAAFAEEVMAWRDWASHTAAELRWTGYRLLGTPQQAPTYLVLPSLDTADELAGTTLRTQIARARSRARALVQRYPHLLEPGRSAVADDEDAQAEGGMRLVKVLRAVNGYSDTDFDLLCRAGDWFASNDAVGMTPRQVPIEGLHAKWLNTHRHLVRILAGTGDLGLLETHPPRIHYTYLDPAWRTGGGRIHDSATLGDACEPAYTPRLVIISENKDTALYFPATPHAISVEGVGRGGSTAAAFDWLRGAEHVFYWGDMDADGLEILNEFRAAGIPAISILMNPEAYETWQRFGTNTDAKNRPLKGRTPKPVVHLNEAERELYLRLCDHGYTGFRRIEQERIPFSHAMTACLEHSQGQRSALRT